MFKNLISFFAEDYRKNKLNIEFGTWIAIIGHSFYWYLWTYVFPQPYDSAIVRFVAIALFIPFFLRRFFIHTQLTRAFLGFYWYICLGFNLPFLFTYLTLMNNFSGIWLICSTMAILMTVILAPKIIMFTTTLFIGIGAAYFASILQNHYIDFSVIHLQYLLVFPMVIVGGGLFNFSTRYGEIKYKLLEEKNNSLKSLAGSIAHELRNPLSSIRMSAASVDVNKDYLDRNKLRSLSKEQLEEIVFSEASEVAIHKQHLDKSINLANNVIDMTLADLSGKKPDKDSYKYINIYQAISDALDVYAFKDNQERARVILKLENDLSKTSNNFIFKGDETAFYYILFNLVKNALYYVKDQPKITITISKSLIKNYSKLDPNLSLEKSKNYNVLIIEDTGPGIAPELLPKLFGNFVTSGKKEGTGLGLAFCKRTMIDFGGDINCESKVGKGTKFNLYFPAIDKQELEAAQEITNNLKAQNSVISTNNQDKKTLSSPKKILLVDDEVINIRISERFISNLASNVVIDSASSGKEALSLFRQNTKDQLNLKLQDFENIKDHQALKEKLRGYKYDLIITDIQMQDLDGFELAKEIRKLDQETPIAAYTSRTSYKVKQQAINLNINDYLLKPIPSNQFTKIIHKWIINDRKYNYNLDVVKNSLKGLKIIIADDEKINHMTLSRVLKKYDIIVETTNGGVELVKKYKSQFPPKELKDFTIADNDYYQDPRFVNQYDVIIVDINMPDLPGTKAAQQIRDFELLFNVRNKATIIAYSGDENPELTKQFLRCGMDDYFTKGGNHEDLFQIIYYWQNYNKTEPEPKFLNIDKKTHKQITKAKDIKIINSRLDNEELIQIRGEFIAAMKRLTKLIKKDKAEKNIESLAFNSHALKGISGNIGAEKLFLHVSMINNYVKHDKLPKIKDWLDNLEKIVKETEEHLKKLK